MFHVASRTAHSYPHYPQHFEPQHPMYHPPALPTVNLPAALRRPEFAEVSRDVLVAIDPGYAQPPFSYIRHSLARGGNEAYQALASARAPKSYPRSHLPASFDLPVSHVPPTHVLAVFSSQSNTDHALLFPTYHVVLAANCAHLPRLPISRPRQRSDGTASIPVVPLTVPHAEAFEPLHTFLVSHRPDQLMTALLPIPSTLVPLARSSSDKDPLGHLSPSHIASYLATNAPGPSPADRVSSLMLVTRRITSVWRNACAIGVFDPDLWSALDLAWESVIRALSMINSGAA